MLVCAFAEQMKLIVGLGNPGTEYELTRHNIGFIVLDNFLLDFKKDFKKRKFKSLYEKIRADGQEILLVKPQTFMNNSGFAVANFTNFFKVEPKDIVVIHDDVDLEFGRIKIKFGGGAGGHKGLESIIALLGTNDFVRIRIGIGRDRGDVTKYVLKNFKKKEIAQLNKSLIQDYVDALNLVLKEGYVQAMNKVNRDS